MNIAVIGAGIVGLSTALALARDGHAVTVYEARRAVAEEASFASGGWSEPAGLLPLAAPGLGMDLAALRQTPHALAARSLPGTALWRWLRQRKKLEAAVHPINENLPKQPLATAVALAAFSQDARLAELLDQAEWRSGAALIVLSSQAQRLDWASRRLPLLHALGIAAQLIEPEQARAMEPALSPTLPMAGAIHVADAHSLNPRMLGQLLRQELLGLGARVWTAAAVERVHAQPIAVQVAGQSVPYEGVVLCTGARVDLLTSLGLRLPLVAARGYTVTAPLREGYAPPQAALLHWGAQMPIVRLGQRLRISAGAELVPMDRAAALAAAPDDEATLAAMYATLAQCLGPAVQVAGEGVHIWRGIHAMLPDGLPAVGASGQPGIWLNIAHGPQGAAFAAGTARALADLIAHGHSPTGSFNLGPLRPDRF